MNISVQDALQLRAILQQHNQHEKHIGYHILPERFNKALEGSNENSYTFFERERFDFFRKNVDFHGKSAIDIGCNIGYFLFSALDIGAGTVTGYEGKKSCGQFLKSAIGIAGVEDRFHFFNDYYNFDAGTEKYDVGLLLNVLHHLGDDYGSAPDIEAAKQLMLQQLNRLSRSVGTLIFQMGFNWKGNRHTCLFQNGTKSEMIDFLRSGTDGNWNIRAIGIAQKADDQVGYVPLDGENIERDDTLGEFLNRPIFILDSLHRQ